MPYPRWYFIILYILPNFCDFDPLVQNSLFFDQICSNLEGMLSKVWPEFHFFVFDHFGIQNHRQEKKYVAWRGQLYPPVRDYAFGYGQTRGTQIFLLVGKSQIRKFLGSFRICKLRACLLWKLSGFESRPALKIQNGRRKQKGGHDTLATT
jgi:hypothetical protein